MTADSVSAIEPHRVGRLEPAHAGHKVWLRCLDQQMVMICHQDEGVHPPTSALARLSQRGQKLFAICVIAKDRFLPITAIKQMINCAGELDSRFARHLSILRQLEESSRAKLPRF
ncbi:MAG TPA: hypothetical protein VE031_03135 [Chthoniobacterales bacterium]|nr:hypothetical protein [Chthoniobacterales bacterium]